MKKIETIELEANKFHALMRDARRYHWIRKKARIIERYHNKFYSLPSFLREDENGMVQYEDMDTALDAAMEIDKSLTHNR